MTQFEVEKIVNFQSYAMISIVVAVVLATLMRSNLVHRNYPDKE